MPAAPYDAVTTRAMIRPQGDLPAGAFSQLVPAGGNPLQGPNTGAVRAGELAEVALSWTLTAAQESPVLQSVILSGPAGSQPPVDILRIEARVNGRLINTDPDFEQGTEWWAAENGAALQWTPPPPDVRRYRRVYASPSVGNSALLDNPGNADAPVWAVYTGDLGESRMMDGRGGVINLAALAAGEEIGIDTSTLQAVAPGGATRASHVRAGSVPLLVPAGSSARFSLYAGGSGSVALTWRPAWQ